MVEKVDIERKLWKKVIEKGKKQEKGLTHNLSDDEIATIVATASALGVNRNFLAQLIWDLTVARYKLWDEIGMLLTGRYKGYGETPEELKAAERFTKILAVNYIKYSIPELIEKLRTEDYLLEGVYKKEVEEEIKKIISKSKKKLEEVI